MMGEIFKGKITVLSPVHVGSGREDLLADYDFVTDGWFVRVIDLEKMFAEVSEDAWTGADVDVRIPQLLKKEQYRAYALYSMGHPGGDIRRIVDHIKNSRFRPYIPGSSLKGAIRTALAWAMVKNGVVQPQGRDMGINPRSAGKSIEARLFGPDPNRDMMRALQITDTSGIEADNGLALSVVMLYSLKDMMGKRILIPREPRNSYSFTVETIPAGAELEFSIKLDGQLLDEKVSRKLGFDNRKGWLLEFPRHCSAFAQEIISLEAEFYDKCSLPRLKSFYERLKRDMEAMDPERQFLLQMAWGTGWSAKTIGEALEANVLDEVIGRFGLGRIGYPVFPKTRRIVERGNVPEMPLGWIRVDI